VLVGESLDHVLSIICHVMRVKNNDNYAGSRLAF